VRARRLQTADLRIAQTVVFLLITAIARKPGGNPRGLCASLASRYLYGTGLSRGRRDRHSTRPAATRRTVPTPSVAGSDGGDPFAAPLPGNCAGPIRTTSSGLWLATQRLSSLATMPTGAVQSIGVVSRTNPQQVALSELMTSLASVDEYQAESA
jgi:hypothetical protein